MDSVTAKSIGIGDVDHPTTITVLGAGCEVGRSCVFANRGNSSVMFDCGLHPALSGVGALPVFEAIDLTKVDVCLVTHFHLDHCGAVPYLLSKTGFKGRILMTHATRAICHLLWTDYARMERLQSVTSIFDYSNVNNSEANYNEGEEDENVVDELVCGSGLYSFEDVEYALDKIEVIDYHEERNIDGIKISCYRAGHVLGACMFLVEMDGVRILYTGDYSTECDRHVPSAEIPPVNVHLLICESTYGIRVHEERRQRERRFLRSVLDITMRNGKCLLPVFALGRAQEILLILEEHWAENKHLQSIPIFYISPLAAKSLRVYETFVSLCGDYVKESVYNGHNPFNFKHVKYARSVDTIRMYLHREGPCIVMTSPGMLQGGPSLEVFETIASDNRNGVVLTGYTVRGTLADELKRDPEFLNLGNKIVKRRCAIDQISFSAHADYHQTRDFIRRLSVPNVILVHGERNEMTKMKNKLSEDIPELSVFMPEVLQVVSLNFTPNNTMDTFGDLANDLRNISLGKNVKNANLEIGDSVSTVVVFDGVAPKIMYAKDVEKYSTLCLNFLDQKIMIEFSGDFEDLRMAIENLYDDVRVLEKSQMVVADLVKITVSEGKLILEWKSSPVSDLIADSVNMLAIGLIAEPEIALNEIKLASDMRDVSVFLKVAKIQLCNKFGEPVLIKEEDSAKEKLEGDKLLYLVPNPDDSTPITLEVNLTRREVVCCDEEIRRAAMKIIQQAYTSLRPISL